MLLLLFKKLGNIRDIREKRMKSELHVTLSYNTNTTVEDDMSC